MWGGARVLLRGGLTGLQTWLQGTWLQDTFLSCVALSVTLVQTHTWHLAYTGEPGWGAGVGGGRVRQAGEPRACSGLHPLALLPPHSVAPSSPGTQHSRQHTHPWALGRKRASPLVRHTAWGWVGPQRGATAPHWSPLTTAQPQWPPTSPSQRALGQARTSAPPLASGPLTAGVEGAAPPRQHLTLHLEAQRALWGLLLAQAGVAL